MVRFTSTLRNRDTVPEVLIAMPKRIRWSRMDSVSAIVCSNGGFYNCAFSELVESELDSSDHKAKGLDSLLKE